MKKVMTVICCLSLAFVGYTITNNIDYLRNASVQQNALHAATIPSWNYNGPLPLDLQLDAAKGIKPDTVVIHDTVEVKKLKYVRVPVPKHAPDTIYIPLDDVRGSEILSVKKENPEGREEGVLDEAQSPKQSIILFVDGNAVYSSKTNISSEVSDEP